MMGVVLIDPLEIIPDRSEKDESEQALKARVRKFIDESNIVPSLQSLACLKFKCVIGPKHFVRKMISYYRRGYLCKMMLIKLTMKNTTLNYKFISDEWIVPDEVKAEFGELKNTPIIE